MPGARKRILGGPPVLAERFFATYDAQTMARAYCYHCFKPDLLCVCDVQPVSNQTPVWIIQHPAERTHPINSARLTALGLERGHIEIAWNAECAPPSRLPEGAAVLFPSKASRALETLEVAPKGLVVLDGTWAQAKKLYRQNSWIQSLPHVHLTPSEQSRYRIRKQPREGYLSTVEATVMALRQLEPQTRGLDGLLQRFDRMIDVQEQFVRNPPPGAYQHARALALQSKPKPPKCLQVRSQAVLCYGDFLVDHATPHRACEPIVLAFERVSTRKRWIQVFRARDAEPPVIHLNHMGISPADYNAAPPSAEASARVQEFLTHSDVLCAWNSVTTRRINALLGRSYPTLSLKADYANWTHRKAGHLEDELRALQEVDPSISYPQSERRAETRLNAASLVLEWLVRNGSR